MKAGSDSICHIEDGKEVLEAAFKMLINQQSTNIYCTTSSIENYSINIWGKYKKDGSMSLRRKINNKCFIKKAKY